VNTISYRSVEQRDEEFLYELYKRSRAEEFVPAGLSEEQFDFLMKMQYRARKASYEGNNPGARHDIVMVDGADAGQIWVSRVNGDIGVIDISISAAFQNQGIGTAVMKELIAEAASAGAAVRCSVATNNPGSLRFHERLGFRVTGGDEAYYRLEHP